MTEDEALTTGHEDVDRWLREAMTTGSAGARPEPQLSANFDVRLAKRLRPRRLSATGRFVMAVYVVVAVAVTVGAMQSTSIDWRLAILTLTPTLVAAAVYGWRLAKHT